MDLLADLRARHGAARTRDLPAEPLEIRRLLRRGVVIRGGRGVLALPDADPVVVAARRLDGLVTCTSLAARLGLPLLADDGRTQLAVRSHVRIPDWGDGELRLHRTAGLEPDGARVGVPVALALRHAMTCLPFREAVALVDAALGRGLVTRADLDRARPAREIVQFDRVVAAADGRSGSMPETFLRLGLRAAGLPVEVQPVIEGIGRLDLLVDGRIVVEVDGYAYHADRVAFGEDRRRDRVAQQLALRTSRFTFAEAVYRTDQCVREVEALVGQLRLAGVPAFPEARLRRTRFV